MQQLEEPGRALGGEFLEAAGAFRRRKGQSRAAFGALSNSARSRAAAANLDAHPNRLRIAAMKASFVRALAVAAAIFPAAPPRGAAAQTVADLYHLTGGVARNHMEYHQLKVPKGQEVVLADLKGPGKVTYFYITDDTQVKWYAGLVLKVYWDEEADPSILAPLADFFGALGGRTIEYQSALLQINHGCYMSYLPMPFSKRARFVLANDGDRDYEQSVAYGIDYEESPAYAEEKSRLCCVWHRSNPVQRGVHTILEARGRGHYVGNVLQVFSRFDGWWGEGDTLFRVDGSTMTHTPGTEDEYGACWGFGHTYSYLDSGYLENAGGNNRMYRWYVANPVRFQHGLKVEIQNQHDNGTPTTGDADDYTSVAYWYQEEPHQALSLQPFAERTAVSHAGQTR
jgi:hypothetical protein